MLSKKLKIFVFLAFFGMVFIHESCRKDPVFNTDPSFSLEFSADTLSFDTIFTSFGSTTLWLKVYNRSDKDLALDRIELTGGNTSAFRINVDGDTSVLQRNIRLRAKDSLFIFIKVTIDPDDANNPFEIWEYLRFIYNNRSQDVVLRAFGQNFTLHKPNDTLYIPYGTTDSLALPYSIANCSQPWTAGKAHVIYGYLVVNSGDELILEAGTRLHFAPNAGLLVAHGGSLKIRGELGKEVILEGMRMDADYRHTTGQWNRIWLSSGSVDNEINWAIIRNGKIGLWVDTVANENPTLTIQNTIIHNMQNYGMVAQSATIRGQNLQVSNCGERLLVLQLGGNYDFIHCTFANYFTGSSSSRKTASVLLNNYVEYSDGQNSQMLLYPMERADFTSCIIYGNTADELSLDFSDQTTANHLFSYCNIATKINTSGKPQHFDNCRINLYPYFKDASTGDFDITTPPDGVPNSVISCGKQLVSIPGIAFDLKNRPRKPLPAIGAYEHL